MKRPLAVTIICFIYIIAGTSGIIYHADELADFSDRPEVAWVFVVRLLAIVGGIYAWRGSNWARWLLVAWIGYHVVISLGHDTAQLITHIVIMVLTVVALFHRNARQYFSN